MLLPLLRWEANDFCEGVRRKGVRKVSVIIRLRLELLDLRPSVSLLFSLLESIDSAYSFIPDPVPDLYCEEGGQEEVLELSEN